MTKKFVMDDKMKTSDDRPTFHWQVQYPVRSVHSRMNNVNSSQCLKLKFCVSLVDNVTVDTSDECYRRSHKAQKDEE